MASVDIAKFMSSSLNELDVHFLDELRKKAKHSNPDIDVSKTDLNYFIGCIDWDDAKKKISNGIEETDKVIPPVRVRQDRKTWFSIYIPCPLEIEQMGRADEFFEKAYKMYDELFPGCLKGAQVHKDEKHKYLDHGEIKESLFHMHAFGIPLTEKGINMKNFLTRERLQLAQDKIQEMVMTEFSVSYQTGKLKKKGKSEEELKAIAEQAGKTVEELKLQSMHEHLDLIKENTRLEHTNENYNKQNSSLQKENRQIKTEMDDMIQQKQIVKTEMENANLELNIIKNKIKETNSDWEEAKRRVELEKQKLKSEREKLKAIRKNQYDLKTDILDIQNSFKNSLTVASGYDGNDDARKIYNKAIEYLAKLVSYLITRYYNVKIELTNKKLSENDQKLTELYSNGYREAYKQMKERKKIEEVQNIDLPKMESNVEALENINLMNTLEDEEIDDYEL